MHASQLVKSLGVYELSRILTALGNELRSRNLKSTAAHHLVVEACPI